LIDVLWLVRLFYSTKILGLNRCWFSFITKLIFDSVLALLINERWFVLVGDTYSYEKLFANTLFVPLIAF